MLTEINSDTSALNNIVGKGSIRVDGSAMKPEEHEISELLNLSESGDVTGEGDGIISVGNLSFGIGKNTYIEDYFTHWKLENGNWKINQVFSIKLQILMVTKSFYIDAWLKAQRGSNINDLKKNAIDEN